MAYEACTGTTGSGPSPPHIPNFRSRALTRSGLVVSPSFVVRSLFPSLSRQDSLVSVRLSPLTGHGRRNTIVTRRMEITERGVAPLLSATPDDNFRGQKEENARRTRDTRITGPRRSSEYRSLYLSCHMCLRARAFPASRVYWSRVYRYSKRTMTFKRRSNN